MSVESATSVIAVLVGGRAKEEIPVMFQPVTLTNAAMEFVPLQICVDVRMENSKNHVMKMNSSKRFVRSLPGTGVFYRIRNSTNGGNNFCLMFNKYLFTSVEKNCAFEICF